MQNALLSSETILFTITIFTMKTKLFLLMAAMLFACSTAKAYDALIDGIYYNFNGDEAIVTYKNNSYNSYTGDITIPESVVYNGTTYSVTSIGYRAFESCSGLTTITIPNSVTSIGNDAFRYCRGLTSVTIPNSVTSIGSSAFSFCSGLTSVTIPNSVTSIGKSAFSGCSGLTSVTIPNSVTSIESDAFYGCSGLTSITIPNSVISIGERAFGDCSGLTSVTIPNSVTSIGINAFSRCLGLTTINVEADNAFYDSRNNCNAIIETAKNTLITGCKNTAIPNSVTSIGEFAFYGCSSLTSVTIPDGVTSIEDKAFGDCSGLTSITIPNSVTSIGEFAFYNCSGLTSVTIPNSVTSIGASAFRVSGLTSVTIPNSITSIENDAFLGCSGLTSVTIPNSVTSIGATAFRGSGLTSVTIPNSVTSIGTYAFHDCYRLRSVTIGNSVKSMDSYAFANCSNLRDVYCYAESVPSTQSYVFENSSIGLATLHVPYKAAYEAVFPWNKFGKIVELPSPITVGEKGVATFCASYALDFSNVTDIKAYIVSGFNQETGTLVLTRVTEVPAGEGLYIAGTPGEHRIPETQTSIFYANLLKGVTEPTTISPTDGNYTNYILAQGNYGVGFYTLSQAGTLDAGKAYLQLPTASVAGIKALKIVFDENDDPTGIAITSASSEQEENAVYNLSGQRVSKAQKGINIVNGKKVFIK